MSELTCPFCNAIITLAQDAGPMVTCPRCEEQFRLPGSASTPSPVVSPVVPQVRRFSNLTLALLVLGVMSVMAAVGTVFTLMTMDERRANDSGLKRQRSLKRPRQKDLPEELQVPLIAPLDMTAVKILPPDADVLAGVHVAAVLQNEEAERLLQRDIPLLGGSIETKLLKRLDELAGLDIDEIEQVAVALRLRDQSVTVAVRTRSGYNEARILKKLHAEGETIYHFRKEMPGLPERALLRFVDKKSLLLSWGVEEKEFGKSEGELRPELATLLRDRVKPAGPVWLAGYLDPKNTQLIATLLAVAKVPEAERNLLSKLRSGALWLTFDDRPAVRAVIGAADTNSAETAEKYVRERFGDREGAKLFRDREWVELQYRSEK